MNQPVLAGLLTAALLAGARATLTPVSPVTPAERAASTAASRPALAELRGGDGPERAALRPEERAALERLDARGQHLEALRGGDIHLSDHEVTLIAVTAIAVVLLVILL